MQFAKQLREPIRQGAITCTIRVWLRPNVKVGGRYKLAEGEIEVEALLPITMADITPKLARRSGFASVEDLLAIAKHGRGESVYLVEFHYIPPKLSRHARARR